MKDYIEEILESMENIQDSLSELLFLSDRFNLSEEEKSVIDEACSNLETVSSMLEELL